jgi:chromosome segregation ATPase
LLTATEQATNSEAFNMHQILIRDFQQHRESLQRLADLTANFAKFQAQVDQLKPNVARFKQVDECKQAIKKYAKKIPWIIYLMEKEGLASIKRDLHEQVQLYKQMAKDAIQPLAQQIEQLKKQQGGVAKAQEALNAAITAVRELQNEMFQNENKLQNAKAKLTAIEDEMRTKKQKITMLRSAFEQTRVATQAGESLEQLRERQSSLAKEQRQARMTETETDSHKADAEQKLNRKLTQLKEIDQRLQAHENKKSRLLEYIWDRLRRHDIVELYHFVRDHRSSFVGQVFGPICTELQFDEPQSANIVQKVVENRILFAFLIEVEADFDYILAHVKECGMSQITLLRHRDQARQWDEDVPDMSQFGFARYCDKLFHAPDLVKGMLCEVASLDRIPVGTGKAARDALPELSERIFPRHKINRYIVDNLSYIVSRSRSGGQGTVCSTPVGHLSIWWESVSRADHVRQLQEKRARVLQSDHRLP